MKFWKKLSLVAFISIAIFLVQGAVNVAPAQASPYKFSFTSDRANGYFIFDDSVPQTPHPIRPDLPITQYFGSVLDYVVDIEGNQEHIIEQGSPDPELPLDKNPKTVVYLMNRDIVEFTYEDPNKSAEIEREITPLVPQDSAGWDEFALFVPAPVRKSPATLVVRFRYPEGSFSDSTAQPTKVPSKASILVFPEYKFPKTMGDLEFEGKVQTTIEKMT